MAGLLTRRVFTYANVPYRIKPYSALLKDPRNTIDFDAALIARFARGRKPWARTERLCRVRMARLTA